MAAMPPPTYTAAWSSSVQTTAFMPPRYVYTIVRSPSSSTAAGIACRRGKTEPTMIAMGIAVAKMRTESASARVTMNTIDVNRRAPNPNRRSSNPYAVTSSPS